MCVRIYVTNGCRHFSFCFCFGKVWIHEGLSDIEDDYELCVTIPAVTGIPSAGYFGVSAATGGLSGGGNLGGGGVGGYQSMIMILPSSSSSLTSHTTNDQTIMTF